jgi:hypothetical protein
MLLYLQAGSQLRRHRSAPHYVNIHVSILGIKVKAKVDHTRRQDDVKQDAAYQRPLATDQYGIGTQSRDSVLPVCSAFKVSIARKSPSLWQKNGGKKT